jgi:hypothetical protein
VFESLIAGGGSPPPDSDGWLAAVVLIGLFVLIAVVRELRDRLANSGGQQGDNQTPRSAPIRPKPDSLNEAG